VRVDNYLERWGEIDEGKENEGYVGWGSGGDVISLGVLVAERFGIEEVGGDKIGWEKKG
jgi:hypothetical protein